mmetsp:Transcript_28101/g.39726  ORF Transcript_28101/g.39726 Transcript_28101/m.39726 type:complete len:335 (-) Transcript_28101:330-1334(-)|eukprot:CAMPEP_0202447266 /NCGR_PEP_ID=MMETSP1360-20130828/5991_1 /ASSEMBLY_ACC=CAM_ASM_000848 /TAXON_ID=515479 /ORGANISM="Licmophora paradoxa, Strain CCMP2313" /LENGTH=334 /DNA_ID=CAMNT_0049064267 /DNA_START=135 /DNA_END=1139 /DNA_ORIENTATION=+
MLSRLITFVLLLLAHPTDGFTVPVGQQSKHLLNNNNVRLMSSVPVEVLSESFVLDRGEIKPLIKIGEGSKEKVINAFGLVTLAVSLVTGPVWMLAMMIIDKVCNINENLDPNRVVFDFTGKVWSRTWLTLSNSYPTFSGDIDAIRKGQGPCLYVANHASWLDIPILCTVLDPVFKFIAKSELANVPCIGQQLRGGNHIMIDREDKRSQLRTFKEGVAWLKKGVPLMAFPEGMRSTDGRLMDFKGGVFSMAMKANVPIVPISLSHTHAIMPSNALFPVQPGKGKLHVHVHEPIDVEGRTDAELVELVREALLSKLPEDQQPLLKEEVQDKESVSA